MMWVLFKELETDDIDFELRLTKVTPQATVMEAAIVNRN